jgi:peptidoglycan hydrolase CwlO-like protein
MRKFNVELNVSKLNTCKVQLAQIETRLAALQSQLETVKLFQASKQSQIDALEANIKLAQSTPSVS